MVNRYKMSEEEILDACRFAHDKGYGSVVLQSGELSSAAFTNEIETLLAKISSHFKGNLRVTLSCGEQSEETYARWFAVGAHRYLLRIETSHPELYARLHPQDGNHVFTERLACLHSLRKTGYQVGSGIMLGLPGQSYEDIARDLQFLQEFDIDMVGMGPYIEHENTPLYTDRTSLWPLQQRFDVSVRAVAILRILMKDINIAASTALQAIDPNGREKALDVGANVIMPNLTPTEHRKDYKLYANKPCLDEDRTMCSGCLEGRVRSLGQEIGHHAWGDSPHWNRRQKTDN